MDLLCSCLVIFSIVLSVQAAPGLFSDIFGPERPVKTVPHVNVPPFPYEQTKVQPVYAQNHLGPDYAINYVRPLSDFGNSIPTAAGNGFNHLSPNDVYMWNRYFQNLPPRREVATLDDGVYDPGFSRVPPYWKPGNGNDDFNMGANQYGHAFMKGVTYLKPRNVNNAANVAANQYLPFFVKGPSHLKSGSVNDDVNMGANRYLTDFNEGPSQWNPCSGNDDFNMGSNRCSSNFNEGQFRPLPVRRYSSVGDMDNRFGANFIGGSETNPNRPYRYIKAINPCHGERPVPWEQAAPCDGVDDQSNRCSSNFNLEPYRSTPDSDALSDSEATNRTRMFLAGGSATAFRSSFDEASKSTTEKPATQVTTTSTPKADKPPSSGSVTSPDDHDKKIAKAAK